MGGFKKHLNLILTLSGLLFFLLTFWVNDPFGHFESTYEDSDPIVVGIKQSEITKIETYEKNNLQLTMVKENPASDIWQVKSGGNDEFFLADSSLVTKAIEKLYSIRKYQEVSRSKEKHSEFEVGSEGFKLLLYKKKQTEPVTSLYFGKSGSNFNSTLVRIENDNTVYSAKGSLRSDWEQGLNHFRSKSLFRLSSANILSYSVKGKYNYSITQSENGEWEIILPAVNVQSPANKTKIDDIIEKIAQMEGYDFYEENAYPKRYAALAITLRSKDELQLDILGPTKEDDFLVKSSHFPNWVKISKWKIEDVIAKPDNLKKSVKNDTPVK